MHVSYSTEVCTRAHVRDAGMVQEACSVMQQLLRTAIFEGRFRDAARHTLQLGLDAFAQVILGAFTSATVI